MDKILENYPTPKLSLREILETYNDIELTDDEVYEGMISAKRKKKEELHKKRLLEIEEANRKFLTSTWNYDIMRTFMWNRSLKIFNGEFKLDTQSEPIFNLLSYYFIKSPMFVEIAEKMGVKNPSLDKGIMLASNYGVGKSDMVKLFSANQRQVYLVRTAKTIAQQFVNSKEKILPEEYVNPKVEGSSFINGYNDSTRFFHPISGLCIDDVGSENIKNNFGNIANVIGDLIEQRYEKKLTGELLHATTNMGKEELTSYYGERVVSRMREIFNWIVWEGKDRRK